MRDGLTMAAVVLLTGCASVGELRAGIPYATLHTTKAPQAVAECIRDAWQDQKLGLTTLGSTIQRSGDNYTVISSIGGPPQQMADIRADGRVDIYGQKDADFGRNVKKRTQAATPCI